MSTPPNPIRPARDSIRWSKTTDIEAIHTWLVDEDAEGVHGNFLCNWTVIQNAHRDKELLVYVDGITGQPIAFQLGGLVRPGILQVRNSYRGKGVGKKLVARCISLAIKRGQHLLHIECNPSTSIEFWRRMGFRLAINEDGKNYGLRIIDKPLPLPEQGVPVKVSISFYPESKKWDANTIPYETHSAQAIRTASKDVYLAQRVQFHEGAFLNARDVVVEIEIDGTVLYSDKARYNEAEKCGVIRCTNGYFIDAIKLL